MRNLIKRTLIEIRNDVLALDPTNRDAMKLFDKHDLVFRGEKINTIYAIELIYKLGLSEEKHLDLLPGICDELNMNYYGVIRSNDLYNLDIDIRDFKIELF